MKPLEEVVNPTDAARLVADAGSARVDAEARTALFDRGCRATKLFLPTLTAELAAINVGDETHAVLKVFAIDSKGAVRTGVRGPMTARDALDVLLRDDPSLLQFFDASPIHNS